MVALSSAAAAFPSSLTVRTDGCRNSCSCWENQRNLKNAPALHVKLNLQGTRRFQTETGFSAQSELSRP